MAYGQFAYYYDRLMGEAPYEDWLRFSEKCWERYGSPQSIVDLGCGTGSIAIPLARSGMEVTGIDLSDDMLAVARMKQEESERRYGQFGSDGSIAWLQQDMRSWSLPEPVDCVISFFDCINYLLGEEDIRSTMNRTYVGLKPGGLFIFDVHTRSTLQGYDEEQPFFLDEEDAAYIWTCELNPETFEIRHDLTIFMKEWNRDSADDLFRRVEETHIQRGYPLEWIAKELYSAGFQEVNSYADFDFTPGDEQSTRVFFVARKGQVGLE